MAFGYPSMPNYYQPGSYYQPQPMPDQLAQLRQAAMQPVQQPPQTGMIWVQGETGAKSYLMAPGNTLPLWDSESQTIYIKSVDASGMPSMRVLDYTERTTTPRQAAPAAPAEQYVTRAELDALSARVDALAAKPASKSVSKPAKEVSADA